MEKKVAILGASGSVGIQALDVARYHGYRVDFLSGNKNVSKMEELVREFRPSAVAMADSAAARDLAVRLGDLDIKILSGNDGIISGISESSASVVLNAILGAAGLEPTLAVIDAGKSLALANKESLVIAGDIVMARAISKNTPIIPVDSEHSAIFQSLKSGSPCEIKRIILTASGGPFHNKTKEELSSVTLEEALAHPTWRMGKKITVDSATLMNKGFEIIEAVHLFAVAPDQIEVVIHKESVLHSAVEFIDRSIIGEFSVPDMRSCIQYAIDYPARRESPVAPLDLISLGSLTFSAPREDAFPLLPLAKRAISLGGAMPAVLNAADEVAVSAFLGGRISFSELPAVVESVFSGLLSGASEKTLDAILDYDRYARTAASEKISDISRR